MVPAEADGLGVLDLLFLIVEYLKGNGLLGALCIRLLHLLLRLLRLRYGDLKREFVLQDGLIVALVVFEDAADDALACELVEAVLGDRQNHILILKASYFDIKDGPVIGEFDVALEVLEDLQLGIIVLEDAVEDAAVLGAEHELEQVVLPRVVVDVDGRDRAWPGTRQKVLLRSYLPFFLVNELADPVDLIAEPVDVEEFVVGDEDAVHSLAINKHFSDVLLL